MAPRKARKQSTRSASDSDSDSEEIPTFDGDATAKPLFLQAIIAHFEDDPVADALICSGTALEKGIQYVVNIDHSDNLDADLHNYTWLNPSPRVVVRHDGLAARSPRPVVTPARPAKPAKGGEESEEDEPTLEEEGTLPDERLPPSRRVSKSTIDQLDARYFAAVAKRITDKDLRKHYRTESGKSLRGLLMVLRHEVLEEGARSATLRSVLTTRRDNHLKKTLDAPTTSAFNAYKSALTVLISAAQRPACLPP